MSIFFKMTQNERTYLDNAAATAVDMRVLRAMEPYWGTYVANAGAIHSDGVYVQKVLDDARLAVATAFQTLPDEIVFTSGGTEANNLAIQGVVRARVRAGKRLQEIHLVTSAIEHSSVLDCVKAFEREGMRLTILPVDAEGFVDLRILEESIKPDTALVSIMYVNNEFGTIERIADIARVVRRAREKVGSTTLLHTDASQATPWLPCYVSKLGVDLMTVDAQKMYGPKGSGCLYRKRGVSLEPILYGGGQEFGLRPGTPSTPLIVGFAEACTLIETERDSYVQTIAGLQEYVFRVVRDACPRAVVNGPLGERIAGNVNVSFPGLDGDQIVLELDARGISVSTRSACLKSAQPGSYMVAALGKGEDCARSTVRISFSRHSTQQDAQRVANTLVEVVLWLEKTKG